MDNRNMVVARNRADVYPRDDPAAHWRRLDLPHVVKAREAVLHELAEVLYPRPETAVEEARRGDLV